MAIKRKGAKHKVRIDPGNPKAGRGGVLPPKATQFGGEDANPRHNGSWKKEDTARYKLEKMMQMTAEELSQLIEDETAPAFERKLAVCIGSGKWKEIEGMINQVYGLPTLQVEHHDVKLNSILPKPKRSSTTHMSTNDAAEQASS